MKLLISFLLALSISACSSIPTPVVNTVKDCSAETAAGLIGRVNSAVARGDWEAQLEALCVELGECVVEKTVAQVAESAGVRAQFDDLEALKQQRAQAWLAARGK
jgi:hypothetical protein